MQRRHCCTTISRDGDYIAAFLEKANRKGLIYGVVFRQQNSRWILSLAQRMPGDKGKGHQLARFLQYLTNSAARKLEAKHGYDTKYAMYLIRLYGEAKELMETGRITLPRPNRDELIEIRKGNYSLREIQELGQQLESGVRRTNHFPSPWQGGP